MPMNVVDSSGWIEYFTGGPNAPFFAGAVEAVDELVVPTLVILEVYRFTLREVGRDRALEAVAAMLQGTVRELDEPLALEAAELGVRHRLPLADSVVYATALSSAAILWTQDADFASLDHVRYCPR